MYKKNNPWDNTHKNRYKSAGAGTETRLYDFFKSICDWRDYLCIIPNFIGKNKNVTRKNYGASGMHGSGIKLSWII